MIRSLCRSLYQVRIIGGDCSNTYALNFHLVRVYSSSSSISSSSNHNKYSSSSSSSSSFVVNYLINSCGLSEHQAITASRNINFKTSSNPDSVLNLLENYGFTKQYITQLVTNCPSFLLSNPLKNLKPKLDFFNSIGLSGLDLAKFLSSNTSVFSSSLTSSIIPSFDEIKKTVRCNKNVITVIKRHSWILTGNNYVKNLKANIELLRIKGVPNSNVCKFFINQPSALTISTTKFEEIVQEIKGMGFDPYKTNFLVAVQGLTAMTKSTWETKLNAYRKWGLSEEEIQDAFKKNPVCMMSSVNKIMSIMEFLVNQMGYNPSMLAKCPLIINFSLEKRIIPRCAVIQLLVSQGLVKKHHLSTVLIISEKYFLEKYVSKYEAEVPELLKVYHNSLSSTSLTSNDIKLL